MPWTPPKESLDHYQRHGYFIRKNTLSPGDVTAVRKAITDALEAPDDQRKGQPADGRSGGLNRHAASRRWCFPWWRQGLGLMRLGPW